MNSKVNGEGELNLALYRATTRDCPYANVVGASDPAREVHDLGQDDSMFALARTSNGREKYETQT